MTFPRARKGRLGYDIDEVEDFLEDARHAYTSGGPEAATIDADHIRTTAFSMVKGGYSTTHVDAALERLEDAFASRERDQRIAASGDEEWFAQARATAQEILDRVARPVGRKFQRVSVFTVGYAVKDVDAFADRVSGYFQSGEPLTTGDVRTIAFPAQRGGYREAQVDLVLDTVTRVMLAVR